MALLQHAHRPKPTGGITLSERVLEILAHEFQFNEKLIAASDIVQCC